eukprot:942564-Rhodomonas_salina.2
MVMSSGSVEIQFGSNGCARLPRRKQSAVGTTGSIIFILLRLQDAVCGPDIVHAAARKSPM